MGSKLRAVGLGNLEVRDVSVGYGHTCVLLDDDSTRRLQSAINLVTAPNHEFAHGCCPGAGAMAVLGSWALAAN